MSNHAQNGLSQQTPQLTDGPIKISMNTPLAEMVAPGQNRIVLVHVGKCAGSSLILSLSRALTNRHVMYEMHCYNSNQIIRDTLSSGDQDFTYLVTLREPISRFVSAYNWDKHSIYLAGRIRNPRVQRHFEEFTTVEELASALSSPDHAKAERARDFSRFGHMGMGQSWYTPPEIVDALPAERTFLCETENFAHDLQSFAARMDDRYTARTIEIVRDKHDYTGAYENAAEMFPTTLSDQAQQNLRALLDEDFKSYRALKSRFQTV